VPDASSLSVLDNCDTTAAYTLEETTIPGTCVHDYKIVRSFTATDRTGNSDNWVQTVGITDVVAPEGEALEDGCIMQGADVVMVSYTFEELFSVQEDCSQTTVSFVACNASSPYINCESGYGGVDVTGQFDGVADEGAVAISVYVTVADDCGNSIPLSANIYVHSELTAATAGAENCKPAEGGKE